MKTEERSKYARKSLTLKQQRLVKLIAENLGNKGGQLKMGAILKEAGYAQATAEKNPRMITNSPAVKDALKEFTDELDLKRRMALAHITKPKLAKASAPALAQVVDTLTKNHQLLTGKATANIAHATRRMKTEDLEALADQEVGD